MRKYPDNRYSINELYQSFDKLKQKGWIKEIIYNFKFKQDGKTISLPIISLRTHKKGKSIWIISGIHGEEPAGPNAIADGIKAIAKLGEKYSVVLLPLCNPAGYLRNWRYLNMQKYSSTQEGHSIGDSEHFLLKGKTTRRKQPSSKEAFTFTSYVLKLSKEYPPLATFDLHEDNKLTKGYIYSQGKHGAKDKIAKKIVKILEENKIPLQKEGKTRFGEKIKNGIVGPVKDGSIDELFSAKKIIVNNKIMSGPSAKTVIVFETPAKGMSLQRRKKAHLELLKILPNFIHT
ncbi:hypothetical protein HZA97_01045 [Candidatus Woesearchaeota archaeon]|nr:hypothetical protein [Candidatus Woesearchaeota archaeon]